jgi:ribulose-5-phosphate 4-epimerase/fuculose-1-phosphate aldolase
MPTEFSTDSPAAAVVAGCRVLGAQEMGDPVWGHVSVRDPDGRGLWLKGGPNGFDEVSEDDVVLISFEGERLSGHHRVPLEYPLHSEVMRSRPDVGSVVHAHPPNSIALAATGLRLQAFSNAAGPFAAGVPLYERPLGLIDTPELGAELAECLGDARALFLTGHGVLTAGSGVATAVVTAILLERASQLQLLAAAAGGVSPELANPGARYAHTESEMYMTRTWEYLLRRVSASI